MPGLFIAFEGLDGSGESTQVALLADRLKKDGHKVLVTKEPTNNLIGGLIRAALTHVWKPSNAIIQLLYAADRGHHLEREIIPALEKDFVVIADRYFYSSLAFGSINCDIDWLQSLNSQYQEPNLAFYIKVSPETCIKRMAASRFEAELFEKKDLLEKVAQGYAAVQRKYPNLQSIDGEREVEVIHEEIYAICRSSLAV